MRTKMGWEKSSSRRDSGVENSTILPGWLPSLAVEAVVAAAAEFGEAVFEGVGEVGKA